MRWLPLGGAGWSAWNVVQRLPSPTMLIQSSFFGFASSSSDSQYVPFIPEHRTTYLCTRPIVIVEGPSVATLPFADSTLCSISRNNRSFENGENLTGRDVDSNFSCQYYLNVIFFFFLMEKAYLKISLEIFKTRRKVEKKEERRGERKASNRVV